MGAQLWTTGPAHIHVATYKGDQGGSQNIFANTPEYLGTCEYKPVINTYTVYEPAYSDTRGPRLPDDWLMGGEHAITRLDLTRWDEAVYAKIARKGSLDRGKIKKADIGTMVRRQGRNFILIIVFPYATFPVYMGMPKGYVFKQSVLEQEVMDPVGTQARKLGLVIHSIYHDDPNGTDLELYELSTGGANLAEQR